MCRVAEHPHESLPAVRRPGWAPLGVVLLLHCLSVVALAGPTFSAVRHCDPAVSGDGAFIAFLVDSSGSVRLHVIGADGRGERALTDHAVGFPRTSGDGSSLTFAGVGTDSGKVFAMGFDGSGRRVVASVAGRSPVLSPNGKRVAYLVGQEGTSAVWVANADGSRARLLTSGGQSARHPAWSPDGERLAYTRADASGHLQVHVVNADGSADAALTRGCPPAAAVVPANTRIADLPIDCIDPTFRMPSWSPDGRLIAVQQTTSMGTWICLIDATKRTSRQVPTRPGSGFRDNFDMGRDEAPTWFRDGQSIAFQSDQSGAMEVWITDIDPSNPRQLTGRSGH